LYDKIYDTFGRCPQKDKKNQKHKGTKEEFMKENITLDPEYADLIIEVNKLKDKVAEKIAERDMLAFHVVPEIENSYMLKVGILENDAFNSNMKLLRIYRKIDI